METRARGMRKAKEKVLASSEQLPKQKTPRKPTKSVKSRVALQDVPTNSNETDLKLANCSVVLRQLPPKSIKSPTKNRRSSETENIYDFEESPSQEEVVAPNDDLKEVYKNLEKKNIVKVAKRKPKIEKQKTVKTTVKDKVVSKKRRAKETTTEPVKVTKKQRIHNLNDIADDELNEIGGNEAVSDEINGDSYSVHSVCSDIIDQHGEMIGLIEKDWSKMETRSLRPRKANATDVSKTSSTKVNNNKVKIIDTIEPFEIVEEVVEAPTDDSFQYEIPEEVYEAKGADPLTPQPPPQPLKRPLRRPARYKPEQSTPKLFPNRAKSDATDIFNNASPLAPNESIQSVPEMPEPSLLFNAIDADSIETGPDIQSNQENDIETTETSTWNKEKPKLRVYGRSPVRNVSNATAKSTPTNSSSSALFDQQKNSNDWNEDSSQGSLIVARAKKDVQTSKSPITKTNVRTSERPIIETNAPGLNIMFGFGDADDEIDSIPEVKTTLNIGNRKNALSEKRQSLKRFLKNPELKAATKASQQKPKTPVKVVKTGNIFDVPGNAQKDIRSAWQSHQNYEPVDEVPNLFSDTETERTQDRRKSYVRVQKKYVRRLNADSDHEDEEEAEEPVKKTKRTKGKSRKKVADLKEKSTEEEELEKFVKELNSEFDEVEKFEVPIVPE